MQSVNFDLNGLLLMLILGLRHGHSILTHFRPKFELREMAYTLVG